ncbi:MAG: hypothetical protein ACOX83_10225 [Candidatus Spyradocola sp.]|jgi:putative aldouronate transport system substrate-binding protein
MKKLLTLVLALLMVLSLAACSPTEAPAESPAGDAGAESPADEGTEPSGDAAEGTELSPVVLSQNVLDAEKHGNHARNEFVKEKFNLTYEYIPVSWGDWNEKIRTWISTDDAPDLINWDLKAASSTEYFDWAKQGAFAPITEELISKYELLYDFYQTSESVAAFKVDDVLYCWPASRNNPPEIDNVYTSYYVIRKDWAEAVGLYNEDDEYTWEEWKELLRAVIAQDPGGNGTANAAIVLPTWGFPNGAVTFLNAPAAEGNETCSYIKVDGQYVWPAATEEYKAAVVETYNMYQEGLIYRDNISFTGTESDDMFKAGLAFAAYNVAGSLNSWTTDMMRDGIIDERSDVAPAVVYGMDGNWYMTQTEDYWTVTAFNHNITEEKMDRALMFWNYLNTTEGIRLRWLGIEGVDYEVTGENPEDVKILWEYDEETESYISPYVNDAFNEASPAGLAPTGNPAEISFQYDLQQIVWDKMAEGKATIKKLDYEMSTFSGPNKDRYGTFGSDAKERMTQILADPNCDPAAEWDAFIEEMMPRVQPVLDELNAGLAD